MKTSKPIAEAINELSLVSVNGFKSKKKDFIDTISMLGVITAWKPSQVTPEPDKEDKYWDDWTDRRESSVRELYIV
jgi:hypothetical protein